MEIYKDLSNPASQEFEKLLNSQLSKVQIEEGKIIEGKITKINLTDMDKEGVSMFDQTTLFTLNANSDNRRYTFFSMDTGIGVRTTDFWLFGGTGDFNRLGNTGEFMDNILYGVRDKDYPYFKHLNNVVIPSFGDQNEKY